jgi:hypothetical protein
MFDIASVSGNIETSRSIIFVVLCVSRGTSIRSVGAGRVSPELCKRLALLYVNVDLGGRTHLRWVVGLVAEPGPNVAGSPAEAERRFPVRNRIGVPPAGLGGRINQIKAGSMRMPVQTAGR